MYKQLTVISDTAIYKKGSVFYGFSAVVNELNCVSPEFEKIKWIGFHRPELENNLTLIPVDNTKIEIITLPAIGGKNIWQRLKILVYYPYMCFVILKSIYNAQVVHTRAPSHPAFIATLLSFIFKNKIWWHKFAGSWDKKTLPFFYRVQRDILLKAKHCKVAINGFWENQPKHCFSFENPCLTHQDIEKGKEIAGHKLFVAPFTFVFVGRLDEAKGVSTIIDAFKSISQDKIEKLHFIGNGVALEKYKQHSNFLGKKVQFHGFQNSKKVHQLLAESHFFLLPSKSEGFPKVIAESCCYGVIPIVSDVGGISHYVNSSNGYIARIENAVSFSNILKSAISERNDVLKQLSNNSLLLAELFTFERYKSKLKKIIFEK